MDALDQINLRLGIIRRDLILIEVTTHLFLSPTSKLKSVIQKIIIKLEKFVLKSPVATVAV